MRCLAEDNGHYRSQTFLKAYIGFMTADPPRHPDTYAESYHRGFFANLEKGLPPEKCGMVTHDTPLGWRPDNHRTAGIFGTPAGYEHSLSSSPLPGKLDAHPPG